jgi:hypothetical protein
MIFTASIQNILDTPLYLASNLFFVIYLAVLSIAQIIIEYRMTADNKLERMCIAAAVNY